VVSRLQQINDALDAPVVEEVVVREIVPS
jgi:hypothetical protein